jgi:hypothetical protein
MHYSHRYTWLPPFWCGVFVEDETKSGLFGGRGGRSWWELVLKSQLTTQAYGPTLGNSVPFETLLVS